MAGFDIDDDTWPTSAVDEPTVVFDQAGMRVPAYALEGIIADKPARVFEIDDPEIERLLMNLVMLNRQIKARNKKLEKALADPAKKAKFAEMGIQGTLNAAQGVVTPPGMEGMFTWIGSAATSVYDAATDVMIGQSVGTQARSREQAAKLEQMVDDRISAGQVTGERAEQLKKIAQENVAAVSEPAKTFVKETASEVAKSAGKLGADLTYMGKMLVKVAKYGIPIGAGLLILNFVLASKRPGKVLSGG